MEYDLPKLDYPYDALEPYIDAKTMEIHYFKHHQAYAGKMNAILEKYPNITESPVEIMKKLTNSGLSLQDQQVFRNFGGGFINHNSYWEMLDPNNKKNSELTNEIVRDFGSIDKFKEVFSQVAKNHFGSGWAWLVKDSSGKLLIYSLPNQDSPYSRGHEPILCLDVWEHAYYLKYQNRRAEYVDNWWKVLKII